MKREGIKGRLKSPIKRGEFAGNNKIWRDEGPLSKRGGSGGKGNLEEKKL